MTLFSKAILGTALAASTLAMANPAEARGYYGHYHGGNGAAIGIGAGILGLAVGAAIASDHHRYRYEDRDYYYRPDSYYYRDGYYWDRDGRRYEREQWLRYREGYERGYARGYERGDDRGDYRRGYYGDDYYRRGY